MAKWAGLALGSLLFCVTPLALAQDAAGEDSALSEDAGSLSDAAATEDAVAADATLASDAGVLEDAATTPDASTAADSSVEDAAMPVDGAIPEDAAVTADATAADGTTPDAGGVDTTATGDAGVPCDAVSFLGECDGDIVRYCARDNQLVELDCVAEFGTGATCGLVDCTGADCLGYFCVADDGVDCGETLGCDVSQNQGCVEGTCATTQTCVPSTFVPTCTGDALSYCAFTEGRNDCTEGGTQPYICGNDSGGTPACLGTQGGLCDLIQGYECATGFDCVDNVCSAPGTDAGSVDSGTSADAATAAVEDTAGCGCTAPRGGSSAVLVLLGLLGLAVSRRRS
ncbi:MAG: MYXO-CTERM sorting domain-containing protein [Pseudomonadota bacterium]